MSFKRLHAFFESKFMCKEVMLKILQGKTISNCIIIRNLSFFKTPVGRKTSVRKTEVDPTITQICVGNFNPKLLELGSCFCKNSLTDVIHSIKHVSNKRFCELNQSWLNLAKTNGLFGINVDKRDGGLGFSSVEAACVFEELCCNLPLSILLLAHNFWVIDAVKVYGKHDDKGLLQRLACGSAIGTLCFSERSCGTDFQSLETTVKNENNNYYINGEKFWITHPLSDIYLVIAKSAANELSALIVDSHSEGVKTTNHYDVIGFSGLEYGTVRFSSARAESVLGKLGNGFDLITNLMLNGRCHVTSLCSGISKLLFQEIVMFFRENNAYLDNEFYENIFHQCRFLAFSCESVAYFLASLKDNFPSVNFGLESALCSFHAVRCCRELLGHFIDLNGVSALSAKSSYIKSLVNDIRMLSHFGWSEEATKLYVGFEMMKFVAHELADDVKTSREYSNFPIKAWLNARKMRKVIKGEMVFKYDLWENVSDEFTNEANLLEACCVRFNYAYRILLHRSGANVFEDEELNILRLVDMASVIISMIAVLARANANMNTRTFWLQRFLCKHYFALKTPLVIQLFQNVTEKNVSIEDDTLLRLGKRILKFKKYSLDCPLIRTF